MTMQIRQFEDIIAWQKAKTLTIVVYRALSPCRDWSFKDQMQRASVSIMNNIAEGYERRTNKDFKNFLFIAKGSCGEVRSMTTVAKDLKILRPQECSEIEVLSIEIAKILSGLIKKL